MARCADAPCRHLTHLFYGPEDENIAECRRICSTCPYTGIDGPCLAEAQEIERGKNAVNRYGIWAGLTPYQRRELERSRRRGMSHPPASVAPRTTPT